jgi:quercetin dioxygenase-like cupin family protein
MGTATFQMGTHLPYHIHRFSEAVTVIEDCARVLIDGRAYRLRPQDCVHVPAGIAHLAENDDPARLLIAHWVFCNCYPVQGTE